MNSRAPLHQAYHLIKAGDLDSARALIKPVLASNRNDIDAWWLAAHAAATPQDRRLALAQVLRLQPDHGPARILLDRLNAANPREIDELAKDLPMPPPGQQRLTAPQRRPNRWIARGLWLVGCLSFWFAGAALISSVAGLTWLNDAAEHIGLSEGETHQGAGGQLGTVQGGDPAAPYPVPVTRNESAQPSDDPLVGELARDEANIFSFSAQHGQEIVALLQFTVAGDARFTMELWDANQKRLAYGVGAEDSGTVTLVYEARQTGQFALVIIGRPNGPHGGYALGLQVLD